MSFVEQKRRERPRSRPVFYTNPSAQIQVALWYNAECETNPNAPVLTGAFDGYAVEVFLRTSRERQFTFLAIHKEGKEGDGSPLLATANVVAGSNGYPQLMIKLGPKAFSWADTTKVGTDAMLAKFGLNVEKMYSKRAMIAKDKKTVQ